jgi:hypothetical protein
MCSPIHSGGQRQGFAVEQLAAVEGDAFSHVPQCLGQSAHDRHDRLASAVSVARQLAPVPDLDDGVAVQLAQGGEVQVQSGDAPSSLGDLQLPLELAAAALLEVEPQAL